MIVVLIGPPGAGKSKQSELLKKREHVVWLSAGQLLRDKNDSLINQVMSTGGLVDDEIINTMMANMIEKISQDKIVLLDGFPRHEAQADWLIEFSRRSNRAITLVLHIHIPDEVIYDRLNLRGRMDDKPDTIADRIEEYNKNIKPIVGYFANSGIKILDINGDRSAEDVFEDIDKALHDIHQSQKR